MSHQEIKDHIWTIDRSGTEELRKRMKEAQSAEAYAELIGQFGLGFYSAFMVSDKVGILTRRAGQNEAIRCESRGDCNYILTEAEKTGCGTGITLQQKEPDADNRIEELHRPQHTFHNRSQILRLHCLSDHL